jgi:hypothetical protein
VTREPRACEEREKDPSNAFGISKPTEFKGKPGELQGFLTQCEIYMEMCPRTFNTEQKRIFFVQSWFRETPQQWWTTAWNTFPQPLWTRNWTLFKMELDKFFGRTDQVGTAIRKLRTLKQTTSAADYFTRFQTVAMEANLGERATIEEFKNGLKGAILDALALRPDEPTSLNKLAELAIKIDNRQHEHHLNVTRNSKDNSNRVECDRNRNSRREEVKPRDNGDRPQNNPRGYDKNRPSNNFRNKSQNKSDQRNGQPALSAQEKNERFRSGECFVCKSKDHLAAKCPKATPGPQTNAVSIRDRGSRKRGRTPELEDEGHPKGEAPTRFV